jgi:parallel beta-helix repeat protein
MAKFKVVAFIGVSALLIGVVWISPPSTALAQVSHHVTNAAELQDALDEAETNGEDDIIYLAAGTYEGNFLYSPPATEHKSLTITGESGTSAADIILDGQGSGRTLDLYDWDPGPAAEIMVSGITVQNGNSTWIGGGIEAALGNYDISITHCIIRNNTAVRYGGGIHMESERSLTLENNLILDNTVTEDVATSRGGGVSMAITAAGHEYTIRTNIIAGNSAQGTNAQGGGLWVGYRSDSIIHLICNTIADNEGAVKGGGVYFHQGDTANVYNNIIYFNSATDGDDIYFNDVTNRTGYNNDYAELYGNWTDFGGNIDAAPLFVDHAAGDYHPQADSPSIDAGTSDVPDPPGLPATDFDGNDRVIGSAPDIGADEFALAPDAAFIGDPTTGTAPLTVQFTDQSTGDITSWAWDFDNDGEVDSYEQNPSHTYNTTGSYTVSLTVTGPGGYSIEVQGDYITVSPGGLSVGAIVGIVIGVCAVAGLIAYFLIRRRRAAGKRA